MRPFIICDQGCFPGCSALLPSLTVTLLVPEFLLRKTSTQKLTLNPAQAISKSRHDVWADRVALFALYSEDHEFKTWPGNRTIQLRCLVVSVNPARSLKLGPVTGQYSCDV